MKLPTSENAAKQHRSCLIWFVRVIPSLKPSTNGTFALPRQKAVIWRYADTTVANVTTLRKTLRLERLGGTDALLNRKYRDVRRESRI